MERKSRLKRCYVVMWGNHEFSRSEISLLHELFVGRILKRGEIRSRFQKFLREEEDFQSYAGWSLRDGDWWLREFSDEIVLYYSPRKRGSKEYWDVLRFVAVPEVSFADRLIDDFKKWSARNKYGFYRVKIENPHLGGFCPDDDVWYYPRFDNSLGNAVYYELAIDEKTLIPKSSVLSFFNSYFSWPEREVYEDYEYFGICLSAFGYYKTNYHNDKAEEKIEYAVEGNRFILNYESVERKEVVTLYGYTVREALEEYGFKDLIDRFQRDYYTDGDLDEIYEEIQRRLLGI